MAKALHGNKAVKAVEEQLGRPLTYGERRVVEEEGFVPEVYLDTKGVKTYGVGQTGEWIEKGFPAAYQDHVRRAEGYIPNLTELPEYLQAELIQAEYRGDLGGSPKFRKLFKKGKFEEAAEEFLDNDDYRNSKKEKTGVHKRMQRVADAVRKYGKQDPVERAGVRTKEEEGDSLLDALKDLVGL
jgi:GH24 family phage-related lysozyme (muramidase)